eukprot:TRINITY_DN6183_c0_g1_i3.p1 TRINITY_DN6183_c0_g1~~TRINITY_DN6183_c0_g1_i3.p1  ORF type:complete len:307 (+),score=46.27 TRINITY_DN6183_c0_g1_i3:192-1112(+)
MVQICEFRIPMPYTLEEYQAAQSFMVMKMQQESSTAEEGVEVIENRPFENDELGKGQYTRKIYHFASKVPVWLAAVAPAAVLQMEEEAWNAYPRCRTIIKCPYFTSFSITIESNHAPDRGTSENLLDLNEQDLSLRVIDHVDIAAPAPAADAWYVEVGKDEPSEFVSKKTGRGPLKEGWQNTSDPIMTAYKLVRVDAPIWGIGWKLEQTVIQAERALFLASHKRSFCWMDDWHGLTMEQLRKMEKKNDQELNKKRGIVDSPQDASTKSTSVEATSLVGSTVDQDTGLATVEGDDRSQGAQSVAVPA